VVAGMDHGGSLTWGMERKYRLRLSADFQRTRREGKAWTDHLMVLCALPNDLTYSRFGFAASKRIGKAVDRNRARRRMREAVRLCRGTLAEGWDMVFVARPPIVHAPYAEIVRAIHKLLGQAKLRKPEASNGDRSPGDLGPEDANPAGQPKDDGK
jgi:ribonuclease P protein component